MYNKHVHIDISPMMFHYIFEPTGTVVYEENHFSTQVVTGILDINSLSIQFRPVLLPAERVIQDIMQKT